MEQLSSLEGAQQEGFTWPASVYRLMLPVYPWLACAHVAYLASHQLVAPSDGGQAVKPAN